MKCYCCGKSVEREQTVPTVVRYANGLNPRICKDCERQFERKEFGETQQREPEECPNCCAPMKDGDCTVCPHFDGDSCLCAWCYQYEWDDYEWDELDELEDED
jgi:hypothetical protein